MKRCCSAPRRPWRTLTALQSDKADQLASRLCRKPQLRCHRAFLSAAVVRSATVQQSGPGTDIQPNERFQTLDGANNQGWNIFDDSQYEEEEHLNDQVSWAPDNFRHIDESEPARHPYHRIMMKYAAEGDSSGVEGIQEEMQDLGMEPGPFANHPLVFAHVKAGHPDEGLEVMREMFASGLKPIAQSYSVLIHGYMRAGQAEEAQAVFRSLQSSGHDAYTGWLAITTQLFGAGQQAAARRLVETREPQWLPDADLYEHIIRSVCSSSEEHPFFYLPRTLQSGQLNNMDDHIRGALQALTEMQTRMVVELRHIYPILEACAVYGCPSAAESLIKQMMAGQYPPPDGHCMECLAKAHIQSGRGKLREGLKTVLALVHKAQLPVTRRMRALLVEGSLLEDDLQGALSYFHTLRPAGRMSTSVPDRVVNDLLYKLSAANMPAELLRTLMLMKSDFMRLPSLSTDASGRSFLTLWLATRHLSAPAASPATSFEGCDAAQTQDCKLTLVQDEHSLAASGYKSNTRQKGNKGKLNMSVLVHSQLSVQDHPCILSAVHASVSSSQSYQSVQCLLEQQCASVRKGVVVQPEVKPKSNVTEVDGVTILEGRYAVNAAGKVLSPSSQNITQLRAELTARNLSTQGKRDDLKRRVMAARSAEPPDMAKAIRKKEAQQDKKRKKQREKEAAAGLGPEAQLAKADPDNKSKIQITAYGSGVAKVVDEFEAVVEDDDEVLDDVEDEIIDPMQPAITATALDDDSDYIVNEGNSAEDLLDDSNDPVGDLPGPPVSVSNSAPTVQRLPSDEDCGAEVATQILALCRDLFGSATAQDYEQMLQAAEAELNPHVACDLAGSWHATIESAFDAETVRQMYTRAAKVCTSLKGSAAKLAQNVLQQALQRGFELDHELQSETQQQLEELQQHETQQQQQPTTS